MAWLEIQGLQAGYGGNRVLHDIGFGVDDGQITSLLGRNGMGKTTTLKCVIGLITPYAGTIRVAGRATKGLAAFEIARMGVGWVPEGRQIFPTLTVEENLQATAADRHQAASRYTLQRVYDFFPRLQERRQNMGNQLSGGEQQMLAIGRALMLNPKLLLLDEPLEGLAPLIVQELLSIIQQLTEESGMAVILVEQHARQILPLTRQALVLERGKSVYQGAAQTLLDDSALLDSWLGVSAH